MTTLKQHLQNENLHRINRAWQYLTPIQRAALYLRVLHYTLPTIHQLIAQHRQRTHARLTYILYPAHWVRFSLSRWEKAG